MRILCAAASYPPGKGGGPKASEAVAKALNARGHAVRVITVGDDERFEVRDGVEVKTVGTLNIYWKYGVERWAVAKLLWHALENFNPRALLRMRSEIAEFRPDIVLTISTENVNVATWVAAWTMGIPCVHAIQSFFLMCWRGTMFSNCKNCKRRCLQCKAGSIGKKLCSQVVDGVIAEASHSISSHYEQGYFGRAPARVIPGAVSAPAFSPILRLGDSDPIRVGYIGMLTPNKGISTLGDAAGLLGGDAPFEYFIAGEGKPDFVQEVISKFPAPKTTFLGWTNPDSFYPSVDVLVVPSTSAEAFGYVCIEALSHGVPVIVARSGGLPEIIEPEESGLVFEAGDHEALAGCLRRISGDRRLLNRMRHGALARAKRYSPESLALSLDAFLSEVVENAKEKKSQINTFAIES